MDHYKSHLSPMKLLFCLFFFLAGPLLLAEETQVALPVSPSKEGTLRDIVPLVSVGAPLVAGVGAYYPYRPELSFLLNGGYCPIPFLLGSKISVANVETYAQWHPFKGPYFVGLGTGFQSIMYNTNLNLSSLSSGTVGNQSATISFNSVYVGIQTGFLWQMSRKVMLGIDIGVQIPVFAQGNLLLSGKSAIEQNFSSSAQDALSYFSYLVLPRLNLARIGIVF